MSRTAWYRSLYWRLALGLIAFLALALVAQGLLFIWMTDRIAGSMPAQSPRRLAVLVASDVAGALQRDPALKLDEYMREQYRRVFQPIALVMQDGRTFTNRASPVPPEVDEMLRAQIARLVSSRRFDRRPGGPRPEGGPGPGRGPRSEFAPIVVGGTVRGVVAGQVGRPPFGLLVRELGPMMGLVGGVVLAAGGSVIAFVVFGPVRHRLRAVQGATERLGTGDLDARAPED